MWRALAAVAIAFVCAQLAGEIVASLATPGVRVAAALRSGSLDLLARAVVPSMIVSELAIMAVALVVMLESPLPLPAALGLRAAPPQVFVAAALGTIMLGPLGDLLMTTLSTWFPKLGMGVVEALEQITKQLPLLLLWPAFALLPGLAEELLFRGMLQQSLSRGTQAVLISGCMFALFHVDPIHVAGVLPLGLYLAWVAQRSGTLVTIVAHVANNSFALVAMRVAALDVGYGSERAVPTWWLTCSLVCVAYCAWVVARSTRATTAGTHEAVS